MSTTSTEADPTAEATTTEPPAQAETDWEAEAKKWEKRSKDNYVAAKRATELEKQLAQFTQANKTEAELLTERATTAEGERDDMRGKYRNLLVSQALTNAATSAGAIDVETVVTVARARGGIDIDDSDAVTGVEAVIAKLAKDKPHLFRAAPAAARDATATNPPMALNGDPLLQSVIAAVGGNPQT